MGECAHHRTDPDRAGPSPGDDLMQNIRDFFAQIRRSQEGATAVEYGIMVALIAAVIIAAVIAIGQATNDAFGDVCTGMQEAGYCTEGGSGEG